MNKISKKKQIINDFKFKNKHKDIIELKFLNKYSKSKVFCSKYTGLVFHNEFKPSLKIAEIWTNKIYKNFMDPKKNAYTDNAPIMSARHFYTLEYLNKYTSLKNKSICDFGSGEGGLLLKARKYFKVKKLFGVEHSLKNKKKTIIRFKKEKLKPPILAQSSIENFKSNIKFDIGILTWTICNCSEPIKIIESISSNLKKNGILVVAESSRILVPFKKPIQNYFNSKLKSGHTHPWHWSFNSLTNLLKINGFELVNHNRYFDENDLVMIFKNSKNFSQKYTFDDTKKVISFLKRWIKESEKHSFK